MNDMYKDVGGMRLGEAMRCVHGKYKMECVNLSERRAERERAAGTLKIPPEARAVFPGAGDNAGELLFPELYTDEELLSVGYTLQQLRDVRLPPEVRTRQAIGEAFAKQRNPAPPEETLVAAKEEEEEGGEEEGPERGAAAVFAMGGSFTFRPSRMTSEGQTTVACANVETLTCKYDDQHSTEQSVRGEGGRGWRK